MSQQTNQNNTNNQNKQPASLQNKNDNEQMMTNLKSIDAKLEAESKPAKEGANETGAKDVSWRDQASKGTGQGSKKNAPARAEKSAKKADGDEGAEREESGDETAETKGLSLDSFKDLNFSLNKAVDLTKGYLKRDMTAPYLGKLGSEVGEQVVEYVQEWAEKNNASIHVQVTGVQKSTALYTGVGAAAGAGLGAALGGKVGGILGLIFGAAFGTAVSCVKVNFDMKEAEASDAQVVH